MPAFTFTSPEGKKYTVNGPEGATKDQAFQMLQKQIGATSQPTTAPKEESSMLGNIAAGALSGAGQIGATILSPIDWAARKMGVNNEMLFPKDRRAAIESGLREAGADTESLAFQGGQLGAEIAGTAGAGGLLAKGAQAIPAVAKYAPQIASAIESGGFKLAQPAANRLAGAATRAAGGAISGGAMAGMINPEDAATGAALGAALPAVVKGAGKLGNALIQKASPEVAVLAKKAHTMGIDIPADRLVDSKTLNALSASLNYVPFSGRATTEAKLTSQINRAVSKTFGQDSDNITGALKKAGDELGSKFDDVLKNNTVKVDDSFLNALSEHVDTASKELEEGQARIIKNQVDEILAKSQNGEIDGQAAYNIKKTLDRIGKQNSPTAYYARDLNKSLMDALNRSIGPEEAANFAKVRKQYGNMLEIQKKAKAGAEGEISMGALAGMTNVRNKELRDVIDIAAQFGKTRESPHGAMQRVYIGGPLATLAAATGQVPLALGAVAGGRLANTALSSQMMRNAMLRQGTQAPGAVQNMLARPTARAALMATAP